jgi:hypothetical protein
MVPAMASATTILAPSSATYLGSFDPGEPSDAGTEAARINFLADLSTNTSITVSGVNYDRSANTLCGTSCPDAVSTGSVTDNSGANTGSFTPGYTYLLAKYDGPNGGDLIWYVAGLTGDFTLPTNWGPDPNGTQYGLSHWALFDPNTTRVPEPATLALFGLGLLGVGRKFLKHNA